MISRAAFASASVRCAEPIPNTTLVTSGSADWHSVYLRHDRSEGTSGAFETLPTPDQTLVVVLDGACNLQVLANGRWREARRGTGSIGMTPGGETSRLQWDALGAGRTYESAHLYIPQTFFQDATEFYRRAGGPSPDAVLAALNFTDPGATAVVASMVRAMRAGAPDLYAETSAQWLATHLLSQHASWRAAILDDRSPGALADARLLRVFDYCRSHLAEPISLDQLAGVAGISKFHFTRLFKSATGETPAAYLTRLRLVEAHRRLLSTDEPIQAIAASCGYSKAPHFTAAFRRRFGEAPSAVRAKR